VLADEVGHIGGHSEIVMAVIVGRVAMVAEVLVWMSGEGSSSY
jgi:hypothetical protein